MKSAKRLFKISVIGAAAISLASCGRDVDGRQMECKDMSELEPYTYTNSFQITNIGDPYLFTYNGKYYCTATETSSFFCLYESEDLRTWENLGEIFHKSDTEGWAREYLWQPQIVIGTDGKFYLYYSGQNDDKSLRIGVAVSDVIAGPYQDVYGEPLFDLGYSVIDPKFFIDDDGSMYLYYSRDGSENVIDGRHMSQIYVVEMEDYTHLKQNAEHILCISPMQGWEMPENTEYLWNEGPDILKKDGTYYLFYSGGYYGDSSYAMGYAVSGSPLGPFDKYEGNPIISSNQSASGPGNNSFFYTLNGKELFNAYHTHTDAEIAGDDRKLTIDRCGFREDGTFYMNGPTATMQPAASGTTALKKVDGSFEVTASSTRSGKPEAVLDGDFSAAGKDDNLEWCSMSEAEAFIRVDFGEKREVDCIFLYRSDEDEATPKEVKIIFSDGSTIEHVAFSENSTEAAILYFDTVTTQNVTVKVSDMGEAEWFGLAEIGIYQIDG